jgi:hypothetical protein
MPAVVAPEHGFVRAVPVAFVSGVLLGLLALLPTPLRTEDLPAEGVKFDARFNNACAIGETLAFGLGFLVRPQHLVLRNVLNRQQLPAKIDIAPSNWPFLFCQTHE